MEIQEKIQDDMKAALKSGDKLVLETLRMLRAQMKNVTIAKGEDLSEEDVQLTADDPFRLTFLLSV